MPEVYAWEVLNKHCHLVALLQVPFMKLYEDSNQHLIDF